MEIGAVVWGVKRLDESIDFWTEALGYRLARRDDDFAILLPIDGNGVQLSLNAAVTSDKPRRHHIDLFTSDQKSEVERLLSIGAKSALGDTNPVQIMWFLPTQMETHFVLCNCKVNAKQQCTRSAQN